MPLLWIHRATVADIFVPIGYLAEARTYTEKLLSINSPNDYTMMNVDVEELNFTGHADLGVSPGLQIAFIFDNYIPYNGWEFWNPDGYIMSSKNEAMTLGDDKVPEGFVPGESSTPWVKEVRTHKQLDAELDNYMRKDDLSPVINRLKAMFGF